MPQNNWSLYCSADSSVWCILFIPACSTLWSSLHVLIDESLKNGRSWFMRQGIWHIHRPYQLYYSEAANPKYIFLERRNVVQAKQSTRHSTTLFAGSWFHDKKNSPAHRKQGKENNSTCCPHFLCSAILFPPSCWSETVLPFSEQIHGLKQSLSSTGLTSEQTDLVHYETIKERMVCVWVVFIFYFKMLLLCVKKTKQNCFIEVSCFRGYSSSVEEFLVQWLLRTGKHSGASDQHRFLHGSTWTDITVII